MNYLRGILGALGGAVIGMALFYVLVINGLYAGLLMGAGAGLGSQLTFKGKSTAMGVIAAVIGLVGSVVMEWRAFPFLKDDSLLYFVQNLHHVNRIHLIFLAAGTALAFYWGRGK